MARDGRADGDLGGLAVSNFADGDDVRVLAQDGAQAAGEGHADLFVDLHLVDAVDVVLHRVLQCDQVHVAGVHVADHRVHGGGLTGTGGTDDQDHAVLDLHQAQVLLQIVPGQADGLAAQLPAGLVQQAGHDLFAVDGGQRGDTQVDVLVAHLHVEASVLGHAALGDVQAGHDLHAAGDRGLQLARHGQYVAQQAVDAHAYGEFRLARLHVDVAGALGDGALDDGVHQADGRGLVGALLAHLVGGEGAVHGDGGLAGGGGLALHFLDGLGRALVAVEHLYGALNRGGHGHHGHHLAPGGLADLLNGVEVQRVAHGDVKLVAVQPHGHHLVLLGDVLGHHLDQLGRYVHLAQVDELDAQLHLQRLDQLALGDDAVFLQHGAQALAAALLQPQALLQLLLGDQARRDQQIAQAQIALARGLFIRVVAKYCQCSIPLFLR